jgi:hypothetical protein
MGVIVAPPQPENNGKASIRAAFRLKWIPVSVEGWLTGEGIGTWRIWTAHAC